MKQWRRLERKHGVRIKTLKVVIEELKPRMAAIAAEVWRY